MWHNSAVQWHVKQSARSWTLKRSFRSWAIQLRVAKCRSWPRYFKSRTKARGRSSHLPALLCPHANKFALSITQKTLSGNMNSTLFCSSYFQITVSFRIFSFSVYSSHLWNTSVPPPGTFHFVSKFWTQEYTWTFCTRHLYSSLTLDWEKWIEKSKMQAGNGNTLSRTLIWMITGNKCLLLCKYCSFSA